MIDKRIEPDRILVAQLTGVHQFTLGASITLYLNPTQVHVFDAAGNLLVAPAAAEGH